ncbi:ribose transport system substrate-binding protein [Nocardioides thalensis]|uniref:Ribose transport system substrate-binding protein n=1 Tax=Nocardioides thalensis TaxID=1914755 RepID=A0A853C4B6_9ACTN|nr:substrate-binding domain-containing protein [Nocardioides thalensis]NYJ01991.1 ribose transport system substrate-binding protein [Nocardioides thalensis]
MSVRSSRLVGGRVPVLVALLAMIVALVAACGDATGSSGSDGGAAGSSADYVALAQQIRDDATSGVVYAPQNEFTAGEDLRTMTTWLGPTETPELPENASIVFVSCGATVCNETAEAGVEIAQGAGFEAEAVNINGAADIPNLNQAMSSAIALNPSAIVGICITATQVADKLEEAKSEGIITVSTCDPTPTGSNGQFDAAADYANGLSAELLGWGIVADTDGDANVVAIRDEAFPAVIRKIDNLVQVVEDCSTCTIKTETWQIGDAVDSAKSANILTGIINANPDMNTLVLPYSVGMFSAVQAVKASGRDISIYADDLDAVNQQLLADGSIKMVSSVDPRLAMYQCIDQVIRGMAGEPYVENADLPLLAHLYTAEDLPDSGVGAFVSYFDYEAQYAELWKLH